MFTTSYSSLFVWIDPTLLWLTWFRYIHLTLYKFVYAIEDDVYDFRLFYQEWINNSINNFLQLLQQLTMKSLHVLSKPEWVCTIFPNLLDLHCILFSVLPGFRVDLVGYPAPHPPPPSPPLFWVCHQVIY